MLAIAKTNIGTSFPSAQFFLEGNHGPFRLDISCKSGDLLVYIKATIPSQSQLSLPTFQFRIQALPFELNLKKYKWLVISISK